MINPWFAAYKFKEYIKSLISVPTWLVKTKVTKNAKDERKIDINIVVTPKIECITLDFDITPE